VPDPVEQEPERAPERTVDADAQDAANPERPQDAERG
jgi:hypothetical protein